MQTVPHLAALIDATWPPARSVDLGPFMLRDGAGGGKRVSAASLIGTNFGPSDIDQAAAAMRAMGQNPLFAIWPAAPQNTVLEAVLAQQRYEIIDQVVVYNTKIDAIVETSLDMTLTAPHWPPLAICRDFWQDLGIGPARQAVMARATGPKTAILARSGDHLAGICFVAGFGATAMIHALEVAPQHRRQGSAQKLLARAAHWAKGAGLANLSLVVTAANSPARALYEKVGMQVVGQYHYRLLGQD